MFRDELIARRNNLQKVIEVIERNSCEHEGVLKCKNKDGHTEYYISEGADGKYKYLADVDVAKKIAQRDYNKKVLKIAKDEIKHIDAILKYENENAIVQAYDSLKPGRKELVTPFMISDEEYVKRWLAVKYEGNTAWEMKRQIKTRRGDSVRSKSEMIIADILYSLNIPYRYEYPVTLKDGTIFYSDFTALNVRERREFRIEHLGMLDDPEYKDNALSKIEKYKENGYYSGINIIYTRDKKGGGLDSRSIEMQLRRYLL